ncbi:hypothetical protein [Sulfurisphaera javensis]|uniref:hypothetical protein n=1 Tax=Sulfurisphaera javensis TaxID=2049879 RepID=UPI0034E8EAF4
MLLNTWNLKSKLLPRSRRVREARTTGALPVVFIAVEKAVKRSLTILQYLHGL